MALLQPKVPLWVFPCACWSPYFCSVWWLWMGTNKGTLFPKQIVATQMRLFCTFWTQIVLACFSKNAILTKKTIFLHNHPKNLFWFFFWKFPFSIFHLFYFGLSSIIKTKTKNAIIFRKPFFETLTNCQKYFRTPTHYLCFLRHPQNTIKLGKNKQTKILDRFSACTGANKEAFGVGGGFDWTWNVGIWSSEWSWGLLQVKHKA